MAYLIKTKEKCLRVQKEKFYEEFKEFTDELERENICIEDVLEEGWDLIQTIWGIMFILVGNLLFAKSYKTHLLKLSKGGTHKNIEIDEYIEF